MLNIQTLFRYLESESKYNSNKRLKKKKRDIPVKQTVKVSGCCKYTDVDVEQECTISHLDVKEKQTVHVKTKVQM